MLNQARHVLKTVFGYDEFRLLQPEIIGNVLAGNDTLAIMPTGGGKSLCYQIPALVFEGLTIVVSPLISLMEDQVSQLRELGVSAAMLNSSLPADVYRQNADAVTHNRAKLLYLAPETLLMPRVAELLKSRRVDCFCIDEAHCISEWGHDFRPEYRKMAEVRQGFSNAVCIALTATATPRVREDISHSLNLRNSSQFVAGFDRPNLFVEVRDKKDPTRQTLEYVKAFPNQSGIVYCATKAAVDELAADLKAGGCSAAPYHAGLSTQVRKKNQEQFIRDNIQIMVATVAFGMGINKPNVRFVLHFDLPQNIESYYQQIGRAGRDGLPSRCLLLFSYGDIQKARFFINQKKESEQRTANFQLKSMVDLAETEDCRRVPLLKYFGDAYSENNCGGCDNCTEEREEAADVTVVAQKFLSCVARTDQRFGASHLVDVLKGSKSQRVLKCGHDKLSVYGIGTEYAKPLWQTLSRKLVQQGLLIEDQDYGSLKLTPEAWEVMKGQRKVAARIHEHKQSTNKPKTPKAALNVEHDDHLFDELRAVRKTIADNESLPPYMIWSDKTLVEMAAYFPHSLEALLPLNGVGPVKAEKYGETFVEKIKEYCAENGIKEKPKGDAVSLASFKKESGSKKPAKDPRHIVVGRRYAELGDLDTLLLEVKAKPTTIYDYMYQYLVDGNLLQNSSDLVKRCDVVNAEQKEVFAAFEEFGISRLKPAFDALGGRVSYDDMKLLRLIYMIN